MQAVGPAQAKHYVSNILKIVGKTNFLIVAAVGNFTFVNFTISISINPGRTIRPVFNLSLELHVVQTKNHHNVIFAVLLDFSELDASEYGLGNLGALLGAKFLIVGTDSVGNSDVNNGLGAGNEDDRVALVLVDIDGLLDYTLGESCEVSETCGLLEAISDFAIC